MAIRKIDELIKRTSHPLEDHFDIEKGSTEIVVTERNTELVKYDDYDNKDEEIESDYQMIMDKAMDFVDRLQNEIDSGVEGKFLARLMEVAGMQLGVALSAAEKKAKMKDSKDKFNLRKMTGPAGKTVNNTTIIMDRNELLAKLMNNRDVIEGEHVEIKEENKESK